MTIIKLGMITIPVMLVSFSNSRYSSSQLHLFSNCCNERVKLKKTCGNCNKELLADEISKGLDKDTILTESQQEQLKEKLENGIIEIISAKEITEATFYDLIPFIQKSQLILPSIRKGYRKNDLKIFYAFESALKKLNKLCICKYVNRGLEHLVIVFSYKGNLISAEVPFNTLNNIDEIKRLKEAVANESRGINKDEFSKEAESFVSNFKNNAEIEEIKEEKKALLKKFIEQIRNGDKEEKEEIREINPFAI